MSIKSTSSEGSHQYNQFIGAIKTNNNHFKNVDSSLSDFSNDDSETIIRINDNWSNLDAVLNSGNSVSDDNYSNNLEK